jgi:biopolymer transport protein ExbD
MRFKNQQQSSQIPEVNLVPMMDVMMSVLTFFIITSMSLTGQRIAGINLPGTSGEGAEDRQNTNTLVVGLNRQRQILLESKIVNIDQLEESMQSYLSKNPQGAVILKADRELPYQEVEKLLKEMGKIGGSNVALEIEQK